MFNKILLFQKITGKKVSDFAVSYRTTWFITEDGDLYGCGDGSYGQQGNGSTNVVKTFTKRASNVKNVYCSNFTTWYLTKNGDLYGTGYGGRGQQGNGSTTSSNAFTKRASNVAAFACSPNTSWYIATNGDLYGCGYGGMGQQGNGSTSDVTTFTKRASSVKSVSCAPYTTWYIATNGDLYGCGQGKYGIQGNSAVTDVNTFTKRASGVASVITNERTTWYLATNGDLYGCGYGALGQQGNNSGEATNYVKTFTKRASGVKVFSTTSDSSWYVTTGGDLFGCGKILDGSEVLAFTKYASNVVDVFAELYCQTYYIHSNGDLYEVIDGQFTKVAPNVTKARMSDYTYWYLLTNGDLYGCGYGDYGQQGNGSTSNVDAYTKRN